MPTPGRIDLCVSHPSSPVGSETHFKVVIISDSFKAAKTPIARHRLVNEILRDEVASDGPVHALRYVVGNFSRSLLNELETFTHTFTNINQVSWP